MDPLKELEGLDPPHQLALVKNLGGREVVWAILGGEKTVRVEDAVQLLFDKNGRRIPKGLQSNVCDADRSFRLNQPKMDEEVDFADRILRLHGCLGIDTGITARQFKEETERLLGIIDNNPQIAKIANGIYLPVILPKMVTGDLGAELELYLAGVANSYARTFCDRKLYNHRKNTLANEVSIVEGSRQDQLISRMKEGPVIGIHFPNPLQGFSIHADREQMSKLPKGFILSGMDTPPTMIMWIDVLARDWNTPGLDLAALQWQSAGCSLCFKALDGNLVFDLTDILAAARDDYSGGLFFLG